MARSLSLDKHTLVNQLRKVTKEVMAVTGDGTKDAPDLHEADIGLAMGIAGTEVAKENADVVIVDNNFTTIVNVSKWGRAVYINIQKFVQFQLTVNIVALILNFVSACISADSAKMIRENLEWIRVMLRQPDGAIDVKYYRVGLAERSLFEAVVVHQGWYFGRGLVLERCGRTNASIGSANDARQSSSSSPTPDNYRLVSL